MPPVPDPTAQADALQLVVPADPVSVRAALRRIVDAAPVSRFPPDARATVELVLAEVLNNVAEHAYSDRPGSVAVTLVAGAEGLACEIVDTGRPMPGGDLPAGLLPRARDTALADLPEGGFGWYMIRSLTQGLDYSRTGAQNRLRFVIPCGQ